MVCQSGLDARRIARLALEFGPGDRVRRKPFGAHLHFQPPGARRGRNLDEELGSPSLAKTRDRVGNGVRVGAVSRPHSQLNWKTDARLAINISASPNSCVSSPICAVKSGGAAEARSRQASRRCVRGIRRRRRTQNGLLSLPTRTYGTSLRDETGEALARALAATTSVKFASANRMKQCSVAKSLRFRRRV